MNKMTNTDAIYILKKELNGIPSDFYDEDYEQFRQAVELACDALLKLPTKLQQSPLFCPRCHVATVHDDCLTINYCPHCGYPMKKELGKENDYAIN